MEIAEFARRVPPGSRSRDLRHHLDASEAPQDVGAVAAQLFGLPKSLVVNGSTVLKALDMLQKDSSLLRSVFQPRRGPFMYEWFEEWADSMRRGAPDQGLSFVDLAQALLWFEASPAAFPFAPRIASESQAMEELSARLEVPSRLISLLVQIGTNFRKQLGQVERIQKASAEFLELEVPYGLSPKIQASTIGSILKHASYAALVPVGLGVHEVGTAIHQHEWALAFQTAATTGGSVLVVLSLVAISQRVVQWIAGSSDE